jgi:hypothetical protein
MIYVFKTSVKTKRQARALKPKIHSILPDAKSNFDLDDIDKILRVESHLDAIGPIINLLRAYDFEYQELE